MCFQGRRQIQRVGLEIRSDWGYDSDSDDGDSNPGTRTLALVFDPSSLPPPVVYYGYPKCGTCRKAKKWLETNSLDFQEVNIAEAPPSQEELTKMIAASDLELKKFFNVSGTKYRELNLKFGRTGDMTLSRMMEIATKYANGEEEDRLRSGKYKPTAHETGEGTPVGSRSGKPSQLLLEKPWP